MNTASYKNIKLLAALIVVAALALTGMAVASQAGAQTLTGTVTTATSTNGTSTPDVADLESRVLDLEQEVDMLRGELDDLRAEFQAFLGENGTSTGTTTPDNGSGNATTSQGITISPQSSSARGGTNVDFNGRGFWANEQVTVMMGSQVVTVARADGGGNFSTGSLSLPRETGTYNFTFRGDWSGMTGAATVNVNQ